MSKNTSTETKAKWMGRLSPSDFAETNHRKRPKQPERNLPLITPKKNQNSPKPGLKKKKKRTSMSMQIIRSILQWIKNITTYQVRLL